MTERGREDGPPALASAEPRRARILIVEDEPALLRTLRIGLRARGYEVLTAAGGWDALSQAALRQPDAVLLDLGLPDRDGTDVIWQLRRWSQVPVIVLSGRAGAHDKIGALDAGADDYVTKPFAMEELLARLRAALRRGAALRPAEVVVIGGCRIDLVARTVLRRAGARGGSGQSGADGGSSRSGADGARGGSSRAGADGGGSTTGHGSNEGHGQAPQTVRLAPAEWQLLEILLRSPGQLVASARLLAALQAAGFDATADDLRFHMAGLRRKLEDDPPRPRHLLIEPGMGYRYRP
jgi:two-component system KDP operon response regulator KdpE